MGVHTDPYPKLGRGEANRREVEVEDVSME
jgi:hypothetical protein